MKQLCLPAPVGRQAQRDRNSWQGACTGWTLCSRGCNATCCWSKQMPLRLVVRDLSKGACKSVLHAAGSHLQAGYARRGHLSSAASPQLLAEPVLVSPSVGKQHVRPAGAVAVLHSLVTRMKLATPGGAFGAACTACEQHNWGRPFMSYLVRAGAAPQMSFLGRAGDSHQVPTDPFVPCFRENLGGSLRG